MPQYNTPRLFSGQGGSGYRRAPQFGTGRPASRPAPPSGGGTLSKARWIQQNAGQGSGIYGGKDDRARTSRDYLQKRLLPQEGQRQDRANWRNELYDDALANPEEMARRGADIYGEVFEGYARPAEERFTRNSREQAANVSRRYGGNVSQEEERQNKLSEEEWAQMMGDMMKQMTGEAAGWGQRQTQMFGQGAEQAMMDRDRLTQQIMQMIEMMQEKQGGGWFGNLLGGGLAAAGGAFLGPVGAAAGAKVAGKI